MKALLSVSDKTGIVELARRLSEVGADLISTGGTHKALTDAGLPVRQVSQLTGFPEVLDGRVKTLHPHIHGGILARRDSPKHIAELASHHIATIDLVCVNLYPFVETVRKPDASMDNALENIDIGGPTMLRAAAKNFPSVTVLVDPETYGWVVDRICSTGLNIQERQWLAYKAFLHVASYDAAIAQYLSPTDNEALPQKLVIGLEKRFDLRYGENPHQQAALYSSPLGNDGILAARQIHGKELSYNNIVDAVAAWNAVRDFTECAVSVVKHTNPCGLATHPNIAMAYIQAHAGDPVSAYGGIVACNRPVTLEAAQEMNKTFYEIILAPDFAPSALEILRKKRNLRLLAMGDQRLPNKPGLELRHVGGGILAQTEDLLKESSDTWRTVTEHHASNEELRDLAFAWKAAKHVKSNAIVLAHDGALIGMGAGQPNRVTSVRLAVQAAGIHAKGSVLASDAFFPFPDGVEEAGKAGVAAIIQPGGSVRDQEIIDTANRLSMAMIFTGMRHFKH